MRKLALSICLLALPLAYGFGQVSVSGVTGSDGYSVLRASADIGVPIVPGLAVTGSYSLFEQDDLSSMSRYSLGARYRLPFIDIVEVGASGGWQPKANSYSNYYYDIYGSVNLEDFLFRILPADSIRLGLGYKQTYHSFYDPDNDVDERDIYAFISQRTGGFDAAIMYTKALNFSGDKNDVPPWLDIPYFTAAYYGYLDYSIGASMGYTYKIVRPYAAYSYLKTDGNPSTDDLRLGIILNVMMVDLNASVEWLNFSQNTSDRKALFSLSAGVRFL
jgi:hypothetical protein